MAIFTSLPVFYPYRIAIVVPWFKLCSKFFLKFLDAEDDIILFLHYTRTKKKLKTTFCHKAFSGSAWFKLSCVQ